MIYYNYNKKTQFKKLVNDITELLQRMNKDQKFEVQ